MKFMMPETASTVRARDAARSPSPPNEIAPSKEIRNRVTRDPLSGTPNAKCPNPTSVTTSRIRKTRREPRNDSRYWERDIGVAMNRFSSFLLLAVTIENPIPQMLPPMRFMPSRPGIRKSM